ncbi:MAG TPA: hypothetical protein VK488_04090 [Gaiellaceae bacterium]|nr:hypothetical protein [Gaiellaceae bacterium]
MSKPAGSEFRVVIEGLALEKKQAENLNKVVQKAVLTEIARLDLFQDFRVRFPRDWIGIWIGPEGGPVRRGSGGG